VFPSDGTWCDTNEWFWQVILFFLLEQEVEKLYSLAVKIILLFDMYIFYLDGIIFIFVRVSIRQFSECSDQSMVGPAFGKPLNVEGN
jgi:hypothetical protein